MKPEEPGPVGADDVSTSHRASAVKAVGAVVAVALVPLALVTGHLPERAASTTVQPAAGGPVSPRAPSPSTTDATPAHQPRQRPRGRARSRWRPCPGTRRVPWSWAPRGCSTCVAPSADPSRRAWRPTPSGRSGSRRRRAERPAPRSTPRPPRPWSWSSALPLRPPLNAPALMSAAYLDLELKQSAQILATATRGGVGGRPFRAEERDELASHRPHRAEHGASPSAPTVRTPARTRAWATTAAGPISAR